MTPKIDFENQILVLFDSYFWPFNKSDEKIKSIFAMSAIIPSIWNVFIKFRWHGEKLTDAWSTSHLSQWISVIFCRLSDFLSRDCFSLLVSCFSDSAASSCSFIWPCNFLFSSFRPLVESKKKCININYVVHLLLLVSKLCC